MVDAASQVTLKVNGRPYGGWTGVPSIRTGLDCLAGGFQVALTEKWPGVGDWPINAEDTAEVLIGTETVIKGHVDTVERTIAEGEHTITVTGRDATADLIDCAAMNNPGEWRNRGLADIVRDICAPFGIAVEVAAGQSLGAAIATFTLQKGETAAAAIQRACAARGVLACSDGRGVLVLGENIKRIGGRATRVGRWRDYHVYAQSGQWDDAAANSGTKGHAHDGGMRRYRPTARLADDLADGVTAADQAAYDAMVAKAKAEAVDVTVWGWTHAGGVWRPNRLVYVKAPAARVEGWRLIAGVDAGIDAQAGTITRLSLVGPRAFDQLAEKEKGSVSW